jgi:hypothetical protein
MRVVTLSLTGNRSCSWVPSGARPIRRPQIARAARAIKEAHHARGELKWAKVSPSRADFFIELVDFFLASPYLNHRGLVVREKGALDHSCFNRGSHDSFYYKMYFYVPRNILAFQNHCSVFLDLKDTRSQMSITKLREVPSNPLLDSEQTTIRRIQQARSTESELLQLADLLTGGVGYVNRGPQLSLAKAAVAERIRVKSQVALTQSAPPWEEQFNPFFFLPRSDPHPRFCLTSSTVRVPERLS